MTLKQQVEYFKNRAAQAEKLNRKFEILLSRYKRKELQESLVIELCKIVESEFGHYCNVCRRHKKFDHLCD